MNYAQFTQAIQDYATNYETSFVAHIPDFLRMAEKRIYQEAKLPVEQQAQSFNITGGQSSLDISSLTGYIATDSLAVRVSGQFQYLDNKEEEYLRSAFPDTAVTGTPRLYNIYDVSTIKFMPTADTSYTMELRYYSYPASIVTVNTTWLGENFEFALLYGALREAAVYMKEEVDVIAMYEARYKEALVEVKTFGDERANLDTYRDRGFGATRNG